GTDQGLVEQVFLVRIRHVAAVSEQTLAGAIGAAPTKYLRAPRLWHLGKNIQAGAYVFTSLRVVSGGSQHGIRPELRPFLILIMEFAHGDAKLFGRSPDLVHGDKPVVVVAGRVLKPLGHHRAGQLLELQREVEFLAIRLRVFAFTPLQQQDIAQKIKTGRGLIRVAAFGAHDSFIDSCAVAIRDLSALVDVGAINREAGDGLADYVAQRFTGKIAGEAVGDRDFIQNMGQNVDFTGQRHVHDQLLAVVDQQVHVLRRSGETVVEISEEPFIATIDEQPVDQRGELVARSAVYRPLLRQLLARHEDLLDRGIEQRTLSGFRLHQVVLAEDLLHVQLNTVFRQRRPGLGAHTLAGGKEHLQAHKVLPRVQQAVAMVDTDAVHHVLRQQAAQQLVCGRKDTRILHA